MANTCVQTRSKPVVVRSYRVAAKRIAMDDDSLPKCATYLSSEFLNDAWLFRLTTYGQRSALIWAVDQEIDKLDLRDRLKLVRSIKKAIKQPNYTLQDSELASVQRICLGYSQKSDRCFYDVLGVATLVYDDDAQFVRRVDSVEFISGSGFHNLTVRNAAIISFELPKGSQLARFWSGVGKNLEESPGEDKGLLGFSITDDVCHILIPAGEVSINGTIA